MQRGREGGSTCGRPREGDSRRRERAVFEVHAAVPRTVHLHHPSVPDAGHHVPPFLQVRATCQIAWPDAKHSPEVDTGCPYVPTLRQKRLRPGPQAPQDHAVGERTFTSPTKHVPNQQRASAR